MATTTGSTTQSTNNLAFPSPELIRLWDSALHDAHVRGVKPPDPDRQRADDIYLAEFVLASSDSQVMDWVTIPQVVSATEVLIACDGLNDQLRRYVVRQLAKRKQQDVGAVRRLIVQQGPAFVPTVLAERTTLGDDYSVALMRDIGSANAAGLTELLAICQRPSDTVDDQVWAVELLDRATRGDEAPPLPVGAIEAWRRLSKDPRPEIATAASHAVARPPLKALAVAIPRQPIASDAPSLPTWPTFPKPGESAFPRAPSANEIATWDVMLSQARSRAVYLPNVPGLPTTLADLAGTRDQDTDLAEFFVQNAEWNRQALWVTPRQLAMAAEVIGFHGVIRDYHRGILVRHLRARNTGDAGPVRQVVISQGADIVGEIVASKDDLGFDYARDLIRDIAIQTPAALKQLLVVSLDPQRQPSERWTAIIVLDELTSGKSPLPLPAGTLDGWETVARRSGRFLGDAAAAALIRRPESGFTEADRAAFGVLAAINEEVPASNSRPAELLRAIQPGKGRSLLMSQLIERMHSTEAPERRFAASYLVRVPDAGEDASDALAWFLVLGPLPAASTPNYRDADEVLILACVDTLVRSGRKSIKAVPVLAGILTDPIRGEWAERVLNAVGPDAVPPLLAEYRQAAATNEPFRVQYVRAMGLRSMAGPAARAALLEVLGGKEPFVAVRLEAIAGIANTASGASPEELAALRSQLLTALKSDLPGIPLAAANALAELRPGDDADLSLAVDWVKNGDREHRVAGARLLASAGPRTAEAAVAPLLRMSDNVCSIQRGAAAVALVAIDPEGKQLSPAVIASVFHHDAVMRSHLVAAAKRAGDGKLRDRLKDLAANEPDPQVRESAKQMLEALWP
ncbi:hypothetical protein [Humisphaera borealis]|uniref:HEAT repeat domain-containing protein n=1 Tax=Humisphaera borealis TaxID=2807512 RepID=A0A7M2X0W3_9BACT|nr:hypothetical protein [Humisphaera borealis]QOV91333.1 hypothetical protein IPV69_08255 [Humisphaera borealis]